MDAELATPLSLASGAGCLNGVSVHLAPLPLLFAILYDSAIQVKQLLTHQAKPELRNAAGLSPVAVAAKAGHTAVRTKPTAPDTSG